MNQPKLISSTWLIDGEIVTSFADPTTAPAPIDPDLYDENGWTLDMQHGCVGNKAVDEYLAAMATGDEYQRAVAAAAATRFAVILPGRDYDEEAIVNIRRNYQQDSDSFISGWLGGWMFEPFNLDVQREADGHVKGKKTGLEGFAVPIFGANLNVIHEEFVAEYMAHLKSSVAAMKFRANNPNAPEPIARG